MPDSHHQMANGDRGVGNVPTDAPIVLCLEHCRQSNETAFVRMPVALGIQKPACRVKRYSRRI